MHISIPAFFSFVAFTGLFLCLLSCQQKQQQESLSHDTVPKPGTYQHDADFLRKHTNKTVELKNADGTAKVLLSADYQGRVMTSTAQGDAGVSFGWINYDLISSGEKKAQFNPVGGEERFWLGPEGGQYSVYFKKDDAFTIDHWQVPALIDTVAYQVKNASDATAVFSTEASLTNYSGTVFNLGIERTVSLLDKNTLAGKIGVDIPASVAVVGYETKNQIANKGPEDWKKEKGLLSIWLLGMMTPSDSTTVIIPFHGSADAKKHIHDDYFGVIPSDRLIVKDSVLYFSCDGRHRSKLGLSPAVAKPMAASYDFTHDVLTLIIFPVEKNGLYVNSKWELQKNPYAGDVVNSYNDGPLQDGSQLGPFYELESSSAAKELKVGETQEYIQTTCHLQGDYAALRTLVQRLLGVDLERVRTKQF